MKGVSLAIETIIYLILAVTVLTILLYFFLSQASPVETEFELRQKQATLCGRYVNVDPKCEGDGTNPKGDAAVISELVKTCEKLGIDPSYCPTQNLHCIQVCCNVCPTKPKP